MFFSKAYPKESNTRYIFTTIPLCKHNKRLLMPHLQSSSWTDYMPVITQVKYEKGNVQFRKESFTLAFASVISFEEDAPPASTGWSDCRTS